MSASPTVVLLHGAFAESASWDGVVDRLLAAGHRALAAAVPLRGLSADAEYVKSVLDGIEGPKVVVGHSYGGAVTSVASSGRDDVGALVYVAGFAPERGESCADLSHGGTLGETLVAFPLPGGRTDLYIAFEKYHQQFCADLPEDEARRMAVSQRPCTDLALNEPSPADGAWKTIPSWFVFGSEDRNIPAASHRSMAERAGAKRVEEIAGASHVVGISHRDAVADMVLEAVAAATPAGVA